LPYLLGHHSTSRLSAIALPVEELRKFVNRRPFAAE
jgi:hypothetical protein